MLKLLQWRPSYSQVIISFLTTFSMKKNSVAVEKYFLFIQNIFSSQLKNTHYNGSHKNVGFYYINFYKLKKGQLRNKF